MADDEPHVRDPIGRALMLEGYDVEFARNGREALERFASSPPDVAVLDVLMPELDGVEVCRRLRAAGNTTPLLMLTARASVRDRVEGLDAGADDYLPKPFALEELLARVRALCRRVAGEEGERRVLTFADLVLDEDSYQVRRGERVLELTRTEFNLLALLMANPRRVLTRSLIFDRIWGYDFGRSSNSLDVYIGHLRRKLEAAGEPRILHTVRGIGYVLRE